MHTAQRALEFEVELLVIEKLPRHLPLLTRPLVNSFLVDKRTCNRVGAAIIGSNRT
jgi:hypothetical protein